MPVATAGGTTYAQSPGGQQRADDKPRYGPPDRSADLLQTFDFRFYAIRSGLSAQLLPNVESCTWDDGAPNRLAITTGTLTLRDPSYGMGPQIIVDQGDQIRCEVNEGAGWRELWTMRVYDPNLSVKEGQRSYSVSNDLDLLNRSVDDFFFAAGKGSAHPNGWTADQVIAEICRQYGVRIGALPKCTFRRKKSWSWRAKSPLEAFALALNSERVHTGKRFTIRWAKGALWIEPLRRQPHLLSLGPTLIEAAFSSHLPNGQSADGVNEGYFASALTIRGLRDAPNGKDKKGHRKEGKHKLKSLITSQQSVKRFGYVHRVVWSPDAKTDAELLEQGREYLAAVGKPIKELTLTHVGIPSIRRGDAIQLGLTDAALHKQIVWVTDAAFSLTPSDFTMTVTVTFDDPYVDKVGQRIQDKLAESSGEAAKNAAKNAPADPTRTDTKTPPSLPGETNAAASSWDDRINPRAAQQTNPGRARVQ